MAHAFARGAAALTAVASLLGSPPTVRGGELDELRRELDGMKRQMQQMQDAMRKQEETIRTLEAQRGKAKPATAPATAATALDEAVEAARAEAPAPTVAAAPPGAPPVPGGMPGLYTRPLGGRATLRLIDISTDILFAAGSSTATNDQLDSLQGGAHDPKRRGFTLQQAEFSFSGAVDPYFTGEAHVIMTDSSVELEEAFMTTQALPWGLQLEAGYFLTEFGRINPTHPHAWDWADQPVIATRILGGDGLRNPGFRLGWLTPLPWFSQVDVGMQNASGETAISFFGEGGGGHGHSHGGEEDEEEGGIGGRPAVYSDVANLSDLLYLARWANGFSLSDSLTAVVGSSLLFGPNSTGPDEQTWVFGGDLVVKWRPADNFRGWPFVTWQSEFIGRNYQAAAADPMDLPATTLHDVGFYTQLLYGFRYGWAAGLRYEYAGGSGESVGGRAADPMRGNRQRISPLLSWRPTEYSRIRLQYNLDRPQFLDDEWQSSVWLAFEVLFGEHPAHKY